MTRKQDWAESLTEYLVGVSRTEFRPGRMDCALFTAGAVQAITGQDFARGYRGYKTLAAGRKKLSEEGFETHIDYAASLLEEIPPALAQPGDVAVVDTEEGPALGVFQGEYVYAMSHTGLGLIPRLKTTRAFKV